MICYNDNGFTEWSEAFTSDAYNHGNGGANQHNIGVGYTDGSGEWHGFRFCAWNSDDTYIKFYTVCSWKKDFYRIEKYEIS